MALFGFERKKEEDNRKQTCCCGDSSTPEKMAEREKAAGGIKVLGGGCARCHDLESNTKAALAKLNIDEPVELITDYAVIAAYGVMSTPALVVDNKVVSCGKVLKAEEVAEILKHRT